MKFTLSTLREELDATIKALKSNLVRFTSRPKEAFSEEELECQAEITKALRKAQEAKMWLGKAKEAIGEELPEEYRDEADVDTRTE